MDIRAQVSMVFHLDKCIGCHACCIACKNLWTDRRGAEYMWWNNVETKPGTGYPTLYEDQEKYQGGWERKGDRVRLKLHGRLGTLAEIFYNPYLPTLDDYYEPWTYEYEELFNAPLGDDQPSARPVSLVTGKHLDIHAGPNWDDDLSGSPLYAARDPNLASLKKEEREQLFHLERLVFFYLPRICNHCLNPGCLGACPAGAIYKRGEDGIVLVSQEKCRAWRMCISGCPYKKTYFNWDSGKAEKCILCYPRQESRQAPACFHACVGRIRSLGVVLYDAEGIPEAAARPDQGLVYAQRDLLLDPFDPGVIFQAKQNGISDQILDAARKSPVFRYVKTWKLALPLHPEFRTLPMLFYVPPLLPVFASIKDGRYDSAADFFSSLASARIPIRYFASLLTGGDEETVLAVYRKLIALRLYQRDRTVGDLPREEVKKAVEEAQTSPEELEAIYEMSALPTFDERFVIPPFLREKAIGAIEEPGDRKGEEGIGFSPPPHRGP